MIVILTFVTITPPTSKRTSRRIGGYGRGFGENTNMAAFCKNKLTPIAVISGVRRGADRTGRYASASIVAPNRAATAIANTSTTIAKYSGKPALPKRSTPRPTAP